MTQFNIYEAKTNLSKIAKLLENKEEDYVIISRNNKPILKISLYDKSDRSTLFGAGKNMFEIPNNFDDIDIESDFEGEIF